MSSTTDWRRALPSLERVLSSPEAGSAVAQFGREEFKRAAGDVLEEVRRGDAVVASVASVVAAATESLTRALALPLRTVINGSGVVIHTNLGRAPISGAVLQDAHALLTTYSNLEYDLESGQRGKRNEHLRSLCHRLFGCESALLVNNNAAATMLALGAIAGGREVVVSRGELVEIGGAFRVPDVIEQGGARLREIGTTNRTRAADYEAALNAESGAILRVHRSNFEIVGFTEQPSIGELVEVARRRNVPFIYDEGSGRIVDLAKYGFARSETIRELFDSGVDVVTASTDKLIGASQGGLILGREDLVARCAKHPLMRALRAGKESFAIVAATLFRFAQQSHERDVTIYRMISQPLEELRRRAATLSEALQCGVRDVRSALGGGTTPTETVASCALSLSGSAERLATALRTGRIPVVGRIESDELLIDLRTVLPEQEGDLVEMMREAVSTSAG